MVELPPTKHRQALESALAKVPRRLREDAIQEAWVAHLSGKNPANAIRSFARRELEYDKRHVELPENQDQIDQRSL
jgi:hypothetical protein